MKLLDKIKNLTQFGPPAAAAAAAAAGTSAGTSAGIGAGTAGVVGSAVSGGIGLISSIGNIIQNYKSRAQNQENWEKTFEYQKELNRLLMEREDTAVQRYAKDLEAAGINPMLAGLGGASAQPGGIINPLQQQSQPIDASGVIQGLSSMTGALEEIATREFTASENEKERVLKSRQIDIERFNSETARLQEENTNEYNKLKGKLEERGLDNEEREMLIKEQEFYDQMEICLPCCS